MGKGIKVEAVKTELENSIKKLDALYEKCMKDVNKEETMTDKGMASENLVYVENNYNEIKKELGYLVEAVKKVIENAKDGYIEEDDTYTSMFEAVSEMMNSSGNESE